MIPHFLCAVRVRQNRRDKNCRSHLYLAHLYGVPISSYIKVIEGSGRAKLNWERHSRE
jgi:hypothetical protein